MFDEKFWENYWQKNNTPWDMGHISPPLKEYFDQITDKSIKIFIPGSGNSWEAEYLWKSGFKNLYVADISYIPLQNFLNRVKGFPEKKVIHEDFFNISDTFDLVIEQTFFCALHPDQRQKYVKHINRLLSPGGRIIGLLFTFPLNPRQSDPPFGGSVKEYKKLFSSFKFKAFAPAYNSHPARKGNEIFFILEKKTDNTP